MEWHDKKQIEGNTEEEEMKNIEEVCRQLQLRETIEDYVTRQMEWYEDQVVLGFTDIDTVELQNFTKKKIVTLKVEPDGRVTIEKVRKM